MRQQLDGDQLGALGRSQTDGESLGVDVDLLVASFGEQRQATSD
jgi:hypothetical protein